MARNREFDDELDALKMLHDAKNHDYATAENPYKNLEGCTKIGIPAWKGIVIRLMDKFERVEQYCVNDELAIRSEGIDDTFADIAVYSVLARILFRKEQDEALEHSTQRKPSTKVFDKTQEWIELERGKGAGLSMNDLREAAEEQQKLEDTERLRETLQVREERKEEERLTNDKKGFLNAIDKLEAERRARDN